MIFFKNAVIEVLVAYVNYCGRELVLSIFSVELVLLFDYITF